MERKWGKVASPLLWRLGGLSHGKGMIITWRILCPCCQTKQTNTCSVCCDPSLALALLNWAGHRGPRRVPYHELLSICPCYPSVNIQAWCSVPIIHKKMISAHCSSSRHCALFPIVHVLIPAHCWSKSYCISSWRPSGQVASALRIHSDSDHSPLFKSYSLCNVSHSSHYDAATVQKWYHSAVLS